MPLSYGAALFFRHYPIKLTAGSLSIIAETRAGTVFQAIHCLKIKPIGVSLFSDEKRLFQRGK